MRTKPTPTPITNDDIFTDKGPALGADPFILNENAIKPDAIVLQTEETFNGEIYNFSQCILKLFSLLNYEYTFEFLIQEVSNILSHVCENTKAGGVIYEYQSDTRLFFERRSKQTVDGDAALYDALRTGQLQCAQSHFYQPILISGQVFGVFVTCIEHTDKIQNLSALLPQAANAAGKIIENRLVLSHLSRTSPAQDDRAAA